MTDPVPSPPLLGMYNAYGAFPTPGPSAWNSGPTTNLSATYLAWGQDYPTYAGAFVTECNANGLVPFVELEPWHSGPSWNQTPLFSDITGGTWDTWLTGIGTAIAATGKTCILTFAHEFNVSGQYPWAQSMSGSGPGGGNLSPSQWIAGWNYVRNKVNSTAGGHALWMWAPNAWTGGTTIDPSPWWPGSANVDIVGIDGYPNTQYGAQLGTFTGQFGQTVTAVRNLGWTDWIYLSETNLSTMVSSGGESIANFVHDMHTARCSGILEFEEYYEPQMTSAQWAEYNSAVVANYGPGAGAVITVSPASLNVQQRSSAAFGVSLSAAPAGNVTVTTSRTSGNTGLSVTGGATLTFTPASYATPQNVTVTADAAGTGSAVFTVSAAGYPSAMVTATETSPGGGGGGSITVTPKTADRVHAASSGGRMTAASVTAFSPSAGSQVRISAAWMNATGAAGKTFTCKDSNGVSYAATLAGADGFDGSYLLIFDHVYATAIGPVTVTVTSSDNAAADCLIQPYVITGAASDQSTAAHNSVAPTSSSSNNEISLTTTQAGSYAFIVVSSNTGNTLTPASGTTTDAQWDDTTLGDFGVTGHSAGATVTPGATVFGWTLGTTSAFGFGAIASEVLPSSGATAAAGAAGALTVTGTAAGTAPAPPAPPAVLVLPQVIVEAGLVTASPVQPGTVLLLDDPVRGLLDTATLGGGISWSSISPKVLSFTITRPSTRLAGPLWNSQAATASILLDNSDGSFDPDNLSGPYTAGGATELLAMVPVRVRAVFGGVTYALFSGYADGWMPAQVTYSGGYAELTLPATDAFKVLAGITLPALGSPTGTGATTGARIRDILTRAGWWTSAEYSAVGPGASTVQGTLLGDTALNLMQIAADSEIGQLYVSGSGAVTFRGRRQILTETRSNTVQAVFGDLPGTPHPAGTELACAAIGRASDDTTIANDIQAACLGGTVQEARDAASIARYLFPRSYARSDLILQGDPDALAWAQWVLYVSKGGEDRFESVAVDPAADPAGLWPQVLGRETGDRIQVWSRAAGVASPVSKDCYIAGITHVFDAAASAWLTTWTLQDAVKYGSFLTLDNPVLGQLDANALAFLQGDSCRLNPGRSATC